MESGKRWGGTFLLRPTHAGKRRVSVGGAGIGWLLGGPRFGTKGVLALGTAQRNIPAALVVAGQNFGQRNAT
jgi:hypothetical protein